MGGACLSSGGIVAEKQAAQKVKLVYFREIRMQMQIFPREWFTPLTKEIILKDNQSEWS
jgi:hypothetical protein